MTIIFCLSYVLTHVAIFFRNLEFFFKTKSCSVAWATLMILFPWPPKCCDFQYASTSLPDQCLCGLKTRGEVTVAFQLPTPYS